MVASARRARRPARADVQLQLRVGQRLLVARKLSNLDSSACLEDRIPVNEFTSLCQVDRTNSDVSRQVSRDTGCRLRLRNAETIADRAATLERARLPELGEVRGPSVRPGAVPAWRIVVHEKDVVVHTT